MSAVRQETSGFGGESPEAIQFIQAQAGCIESLNQLMARHDGLVQAVVRQQVLGELPFEEALQADRIGLWRAILGFDPTQGTAFSTYAWTCIKRHVWRAVKAYERFESEEQLYHRARNATSERWILKRLPVYGEPRGKAVIFLADVL